jgi:uroporphyrinogen-III synthase
MAGTGKSTQPSKVKLILCTQPKPDSEKSPYYDLEKKYRVKFDFTMLTTIEGVDSREFRKAKIYLQEFSAVIFQSRYAIDNFFRICAEMRHIMAESTKYFCISEAIALYLQKYVQYRKRKVFYGNGRLDDLKDSLKRHKETDRFLYASPEVLTGDELLKYLREHDYSYIAAPVYRSVIANVKKQIADIQAFDMIVFFSPVAIKSLKKNFPRYKQNTVRVAVFGPATAKAAEEEKLRVDIKAPTAEFPSMTMALDAYLKKSNR